MTSSLSQLDPGLIALIFLLSISSKCRLKGLVSFSGDWLFKST